MGKNKWKIFGVVVIFLIMGLVSIGALKYLGVITLPFGTTQQAEIQEQVEEAIQSTPALNCPDTKVTTTYITLKNEEDDTKDDTFDAVGYYYRVVDGKEEYAGTVSDTTSGSVSLDCGKTYRLRLVASNANEGDNSIITRVISGAGAKLVDGGKAVEFVPRDSSYTLKIGGERHGVLQFKLYDNVNAGWVRDNSAADNAGTEWEDDGITFKTTSSNSTANAVGVGDELDFALHFRASQANTSFDDFGFYVLVEGGASAATVWAEPSTVEINGRPLTKVTLEGAESKQFSGYEYVYKVTDVDVTDADNALRFVWKPNSGQNPTADIEIDFASIGGYLSVDGSTVGYAAAKDDTSATVVYTVQDTTWDLS